MDPVVLLGLPFLYLKCYRPGGGIGNAPSQYPPAHRGLYRSRRSRKPIFSRDGKVEPPIESRPMPEHVDLAGGPRVGREQEVVHVPAYAPAGCKGRRKTGKRMRDVLDRSAFLTERNMRREIDNVIPATVAHRQHGPGERDIPAVAGTERGNHRPERDRQAAFRCVQDIITSFPPMKH